MASVYPNYVAKAERKGRTRVEVDETICWLTGYSEQTLDAQIANGTDSATFFAADGQLRRIMSSPRSVLSRAVFDRPERCERFGTEPPVGAAREACRDSGRDCGRWVFGTCRSAVSGASRSRRDGGRARQRAAARNAG